MTPLALPIPKYRLGVLVPPANPTVEIEYPALIAHDIALHAMRLPILPGDLKARNLAYVDSYLDALKGFGNLKLDAISVAMTGPQYRLLYQGDLDLCNQLSDKAGFPVETASLALVNALRALSVEQVTLVSPYPNWLTEFSVKYWESAGFTMHSVSTFEDDLVAYRVAPEQVATVLRAADAHPQGVLLLSGTGMLTLEAMLAASKAVSIPMLSSNLCSVWSISRGMDTTPSAWMQAVLPAPLQTTPRGL